MPLPKKKHYSYLLVDTGSNHISAADSLDLLDAGEAWLHQQLVKVGHNLVEEPHALDPLLVDRLLVVEL